MGALSLSEGPILQKTFLMSSSWQGGLPFDFLTLPTWGTGLMRPASFLSDCSTS